LRHAVEDHRTWPEVVATVQARLGSVDTLICNAGITLKIDGRPVAFLDADHEFWSRVFAVNVLRVANGMRAVVPGMIQRGSGNVVLAPSVASLAYIPTVSTAYAASKAALLGIMRHAAGELGPRGIRVNSIAAGRTLTHPLKALIDPNREKTIEQISLRRDGEPNEVAAAVAFLCGPDSSYITGHCLETD
jgi:3-oxoacyl-[acyl-carrier protein] reductase